MFNAMLWSFSKKENSTKRPSDGAAMAVQCETNGDFDLLNPVFVFSFQGGASNPTHFNYCYVREFKRYYWINSWTFSNGQWYATCAVDVLASWKQYIGAQTLYVTRSSNDYDGNIIDTTYPSKANVTLDKQVGTSPWVTSSLNDGCFVVGIAGKATDYYVMNKNQIDFFINYILSDLYASDVVGSLQLALFESAKILVDPLQYITQIMWIPFTLSALAASSSLSAVSSIKVGYVDVECVAYQVVGSGIVSGRSQFLLKTHPQAASRGAYLNAAPHSYYSINYPPFGLIDLDPMVCGTSAAVSAEWIMDLRTGGGKLQVTTDDDKILSVLHSQIGTPYQISQVVNRGMNAAQVITGAASIASSLIGSNGASATSDAVGITSMISDAVAGRVPSVTSVGAPGGIESLRGPVVLQYEFYLLVDEDLQDRGRPLCKRRSLSTLPGYIRVQDADIEMPATATELQMIRAYLEGGFFYE